MLLLPLLMLLLLLLLLAVLPLLLLLLIAAAFALLIIELIQLAKGDEREFCDEAIELVDGTAIDDVLEVLNRPVDDGDSGDDAEAFVLHDDLDVAVAAVTAVAVVVDNSCSSVVDRIRLKVQKQQQ